MRQKLLTFNWTDNGHSVKMTHWNRVVVQTITMTHWNRVVVVQTITMTHWNKAVVVQTITMTHWNKAVVQWHTETRQWHRLLQWHTGTKQRYSYNDTLKESSGKCSHPSDHMENKDLLRTFLAFTRTLEHRHHHSCLGTMACQVLCVPVCFHVNF